MKKLTLTLLLIVSTAILYAQSPDLFNYQGVARDLSGIPIQNRNIGLRISILSNSSTGNEVFKELHLVNTNNLGLFNIQIGGGTAATGSIAGINWGNGSYYLKIELDENGGSNYKLMGTSQLISVPYALYAKNATSVDYNNLTNRPQGENPGDMLYWDDEMWVIIPVGLPGQYLQLDANSRPVWTGPTYPSVSTSPITEITNNSAVGGGAVLSDGGSPITERGVCWGTSPNPTIANNKKSIETEAESFSSIITGLSPNTTYYLRAYAINSIGVAYGNEVVFKTINLVAYIPSNGLLGWWPFNGNANDESGNGYNGTVNGAVLSPDRYGEANKAYSFNENQVIVLNNTNSVNPYPMTISLWYKATTTNDFSIPGENSSMFFKYSAGIWNGYGITLNNYNNVPCVASFYLRSTTNRILGYYNEPAFDQTNINLNQWYHYVFTVDASGGKIYVNGELIAQKPWTGNAGSATNNLPIQIGGKADTWYQGLLDDIGLWNRALTQEEISKIYQSGQPTAKTDSINDSRDGKKYETVRIGQQIWMAENLSYLPSVSPPLQGSTTDPHFYVYDYLGSDVSQAKGTSNYTTYGVLYNWSAIMAGASSSNSNPSYVQGICPAGWHLPSDAEWTQLENYLADNGYNFDGSVGGGKEKIAKSLASQTLWYSSSIEGAVGNNLSENNRSGFNGLPGGIRAGDGAFYRQTFNGHWWSCTQNENSSHASHWLLGTDDAGLIRLQNAKSYGHNVRCVKDK